MNMNTTPTEAQPTIPTTENEMLQEVYRRLVNTHMAIASRTVDDREILPWTEHQLKTLVNELGAFRRQQRAAASTSDPARTA
jgi:hypothetical protein